MDEICEGESTPAKAFDVTLTFDNGPEPDVTPHVLRTLDRYGVKSTFFVIGEKVADTGRRALAERARAEGHWIGNHTYTHGVPLGLNPDPQAADAEIGRTEALLGELSCPTPLFRPNGGGGILDTRLLSPSVVRYLQNRSYSCVLWDVVPRDWEDPVHWVDRAIASCLSRTASLVVLHDLPTGAMDHLDRFLEGLAEAGGRTCQEFPTACLPIRAGIPATGLDAYVSPGA